MKVNYIYGADGYRQSKEINEKMTQYLWDNGNIVSVLNSEEVITESYTRGHQLIRDDSNTYYMHNLHGDVVERFIGTASTISNYTSFGENKFYSANDGIETFGYCDQQYDWETGNYYMRARYYNVDTGRFISEDPIKDGMNWYAYCGGNPVMFWDPSGLRDIAVPLKFTVENKFNSSTVWYPSKNTMVIGDLGVKSKMFYVGDDNGTYISNGIMYASNLVIENFYYQPNTMFVSQAYDMIKDDVGKYILRTWLDGDGSDQIFRNDYVSDYIYKNMYIQNQIEFLVKNAIEDGTNIIDYSSVESGSYIALTNYGGGFLNGYELINGANNNVGGVIIKGSVTNNGNGNYTANIYFEFNDIIDPNANYSRDITLSEKAKNDGYNCNDYYFSAGGYYTYEYKK